MALMRVDNADIRDAEIFEILLENFPDIIHSVDDKGMIVFTNKKAETLLGYTREELLAMNIRQIYADEVMAKVEAGFSNLKQKGDQTVQSILKAKDGSSIPVEIRSFSIYADDGKFVKTFSILRDIRPIKELQNSLIHASRLAAIGEMASGVAHDINNPLTVIMMTGQMTERILEQAREKGFDAKTFERLHSFCADLDRASKSIQKLVEHLRNFSRGVAEQRVTVDLADVISDSAFITLNKIRGSSVLLKNTVQRGVHYTFGAPNELEQIFANLISNACDAMAGRPRRELTISINPSKLSPDYWQCDVSDTGTGITPEVLSEMFKSFFTTKEKGKGTGLGLSISRGIAKEHDGHIEVETQVGVGTTFSVYLPMTAKPSVPGA